MNQIPFPSSFSSMKRTQTITTFVGWIPYKPGMVLRKTLYRPLFKQTGKYFHIQPGVTLTDASCIEISEGVTLSKGVYINAYQNSLIHLDKQAFLDRDVRIDFTGGSGTAQLGAQVRLDRGVDIKIHKDGHTRIGDRTYIGPYTCLSGYGKIIIGQDCLIASHSGIYAHNHNFSDAKRKITEQGFTAQGIVIEDDCWLGSGVKVLDGVIIGKGSVIGAGAVVTKNIPPYSIAVGVPAKVIGSRE